MMNLGRKVLVENAKFGLEKLVFRRKNYGQDWNFFLAAFDLFCWKFPVVSENCKFLPHPPTFSHPQHHGHAVAQPCVNGDRLSQWRMAEFDPAQIRNPSTNRHEIWNRLLPPRDDPLCKILCKSVHWGPLSKWVKYNENFSPICILFLLTDLQVRPPGGFSCAMAERSCIKISPINDH